MLLNHLRQAGRARASTEPQGGELDLSAMPEPKLATGRIQKLRSARSCLVLPGSAPHREAKKAPPGSCLVLPGSAPHREATKERLRSCKLQKWPCEQRRKAIAEPMPVILHVYHVGHSEGLLGVRTLNSILSTLGTGLYHAGIEIDGLEWSYGAVLQPTIEGSSGVFSGPPQQCPRHDYKEAIHLGTVTHTREAVARLLSEMQEEWNGSDYDLFRRNCTHFSNDLAMALGVGPLPAWVMNIADMGATLEDTLTKGGQVRCGTEYDCECDGLQFCDVPRGLVATGKEIRGASRRDHTRWDDMLRGLGSFCSVVCCGRFGKFNIEAIEVLRMLR